MTTRQITSENGNVYTFYKIDNDYCGNPRYVVHFLDLLDDIERDALTIRDGYEVALMRGHFKYHNRQFGGGVGIEGSYAYNLYDAAKMLDGKRGTLKLTSSHKLNELVSFVYAHVLEKIKSDRSEINNIKHYIIEDAVTFGGDTFHDAGLKYVLNANLIVGNEAIRDILLQCGYKCDKWKCDRLLLKYGEAAGIVLSFVYNYFKFNVI